MAAKKTLIQKLTALPATDAIKGEKTLSIASYNILADSSAKPHFFPKVKDAPAVLSWQKRSITLINQIKALKPSILCLQEVDHFKDTFVPAFSDYDSAHKSRNQKPDGCSIFWQRSQFILYDKHEVEYDDLATSNSSSSSSSSAESEDPNDLRTGAVALLVILQSIEDESLILVANTHLFWHPSASAVRSKQVEYLLSQIHEKVEQYGQESFGGIFVCGDFNDAVSSPAVQAMLASGNADKMQFQHAYATYQVPNSSHKSSSSKAPLPTLHPVTIFTPQVTEFIDYIFYWTKGTWSPTQVLSLFTADQLKDTVGASLPSVDLGSDHLPVMAIFSK
eukprot:TRINITY_DN5600_c0_g1_i1.p1 TRINITY_DN5600_c0_g1~~TRINITY_DN5600_c0_g1_i1.p1  ORF type:complete len:335 (-),score=50.47 TRINITY_DN5600_c0_g1_i1:380-1384(-)